MRRLTMSLSAAWILSGALTTGAFADEGRQAEAILADLEAVEMPQPDRERIQDPAYVQEFLEKRNEVTARRAELIEELFQAQPDHPRLPQLMPERWMSLANQGQMDDLDKELDKILEAEEAAPLSTEAAYYKVMVAVRSGAGDEKTMATIEEFVRRAPEDERGAMLLHQAAESFLSSATPEQKKALQERVLKDYPDSGAAKQVQAAMRLTDAVGKPVELSFTDAISGEEVSMEKLRGKVVVLDFWATWCGPCIAELPKMLSIYNEYKDKGVEFIGISLDAPEDQGGLDKLKAFVEENELPWLHYYQGNGWESEFSRSWGINSIPAIFVVDQQGNLYSTNARGRLETMIPELLAKGEAGEE
ncbi:hypothetical protein BH23PLA1_BH23PLA1_15190 [soil metagenome]